jgi:hypothetical protein
MSGLPGKAKYGGYVYAIQFDNGTVKVGATSNPRARVSSHEAQAEGFGIAISDRWLSPLHDAIYETEKRLIALAAGLGGRVIRREFFAGIDFDALVSQASRLSFPPVDIQAAKAREASRVPIFGQIQAGLISVTDNESPADRRHRILGRFFGLAQSGSYEIPVQKPDVPEDLVYEVADQLGLDVDELLEMDYIDLLEKGITAAVRTEALQLRIYAYESGRSDLTAPMRPIPGQSGDVLPLIPGGAS